MKNIVITAFMISLFIYSEFAYGDSKIVEIHRKNNQQVKHFSGSFRIEFIFHNTPSTIEDMRKELSSLRDTLSETTGQETRIFQHIVDSYRNHLEQLQSSGVYSAPHDFLGVMNSQGKHYNLERQLGENRDTLIADGESVMIYHHQTRNAYIDLIDSYNSSLSANMEAYKEIIARWTSGINPPINSLVIEEETTYEGHRATVYRQSLGASYMLLTVVPDYGSNTVLTQSYFSEDDTKIFELSTEEWKEFEGGIWRPLSMTMSDYNRLDSVVDGIDKPARSTRLTFTDGPPTINGILPPDIYLVRAPSEADKIVDYITGTTIDFEELNSGLFDPGALQEEQFAVTKISEEEYPTENDLSSLASSTQEDHSEYLDSPSSIILYFVGTAALFSLIAYFAVFRKSGQVS